MRQRSRKPDWTIIAAVVVMVTAAAAVGAQEPSCGNAFYDDGVSVGFGWFDGGEAGDPDKMFAVRFDLADFSYEPGEVEITGFCAANQLSVGGLWANQVFIYPDNDGVPDDSVVLGQGMVLTGNGVGDSIVTLDEPVVLYGDFWLVNRGFAPFETTDFNVEHDAAPMGDPDPVHSFVSSTGIDGLEPAVDGDWALRAYLRPPQRSYLVAGMANTPGASNTQWQSKLTLLNTTTDPAEVALSYFSGGDPISESVTIEPGAMSSWNDVVVDLFGVGGSSSGSVSVESDRELVVSARTYNVSDGGTFGQFFPGLTIAGTLAMDDLGIISQLASNSSFRTNIGFINFSDRQCRVRITLYDVAGMQVGDAREVAVAPSGWRQVNNIFAAAGAGDQDDAYAVVEVLQQDCAIWGYGSVIDEATGDPTTIPVVIQ